MATHPPETVYVDDDWELRRTVPLGFAAPGAGLEWVLATRGALAQAIAPDVASVTVADEATGSVLVRVPRVITADVAPGRYEDSLRATLDGTTSTLVVGQLHVINPGFVIPIGDSPSGDSP